MKTPLILLTVLLLVVGSNVAQDAGKVAGKVRLAFLQCGNAGEYLFELAESKIAALPRWHPEGDTPAPVSIKKACEIGRTTLRARHPEVDEFEIAHVRLAEMVWTKRLGSWFYELNYVGKRDGKSVGSCKFIAVVLMDGTSVEPVLPHDHQKSDTP